MRGRRVTPSPCGDQLDEGGQARGAGRHGSVLVAVGLAADVQGLVPQAVALVEQQQVQLLECLARDVAAAAEPVLLGGDQDEVLVEEREFGDLRDAEGDGEQQQVEAAMGQAVQEGGGLFLVYLEVQVGVGPMDQPQHGRAGGRARRWG